MTRATRELLAALARLNQEVPTIVLAILDDSLPPERQIEFGDLLIDAGKALQRHVWTERATVIESRCSIGEICGIEIRH